MSLIKEFKTFAMRGNVVDMAVGIIIGAAFGKIVASIVSDLIMPPIGLLLGGINFSDFTILLKGAVSDPLTGEVVRNAVTMNIGNFVQTVVDFTIIAFAVFLLIRGINKLTVRKDVSTEPAPPPPPTKDQELLTEIRDLLKSK